MPEKAPALARPVIYSDSRHFLRVGNTDAPPHEAKADVTMRLTGKFLDVTAAGHGPNYTSLQPTTTTLRLRIFLEYRESKKSCLAGTFSFVNRSRRVGLSSRLSAYRLAWAEAQRRAASRFHRSTNEDYPTSFWPRRASVVLRQWLDCGSEAGGGRRPSPEPVALLVDCSE